MRGERSKSFGNEPLTSGSSPRARGTRSSRCPAISRRRFIPACAGNATVAGCLFFSSTVHPRVRGERASSMSTTATLSGSSPRARGTRRPRQLPQQSQRFIPACAGNAVLVPLIVFAVRVHPRVRGERVRHSRSRSVGIGSSPRARGTLTKSQRKQMNERFIPACAGNASGIVSLSNSATVHPRVRGERAQNM